MALETGTYVSDLVASNPDGSDLRSVGDNHIRLVKSVLQATFPNASHAFRFPVVTAIATGYTILATDHNVLFAADASGGAFTLNLPAGGGIWNGFSVTVMKVDNGANAITVDGNGADTINGSTTQSVSTQYEWQEYFWNGSLWYMRS